MGGNKGSSNQFSVSKMSINPDIDNTYKDFGILNHTTLQRQNPNRQWPKKNIKQSKGLKPPLMYLTIIIQSVYYGKMGMIPCQTISH